MKHEFKTDAVQVDHPALAMWAQIGERDSRPISVDILTGLSNSKSSIYRLNGIADGRSVIAKRSKSSSLINEKTIYQEVLPAVPLNTLNCFGYVSEPSSEFSWLFLEEAVGKPYSEADVEHRNAATKWLALLHSTTAALVRKPPLPNISPDRYLFYLRRGYQTISSNIHNPALHESDRKTLTDLINCMDRIDNQWQKVTEFCNEMPQCLVHGDFISKNVLANSHHHDVSINVLDWEASGWGIPAEDIAGLDLNIYWRVVKDSELNLTSETLEQLCNIGFLFRYLAWIHPTSLGLASSWVDQTVNELSEYKSSLEISVDRIAWLDS